MVEAARQSAGERVETKATGVVVSTRLVPRLLDHRRPGATDRNASGLGVVQPRALAGRVVDGG